MSTVAFGLMQTYSLLFFKQLFQISRERFLEFGNAVLVESLRLLLDGLGYLFKLFLALFHFFFPLEKCFRY